MEGGEISVAQDPFRKPPDAMLARIDPVASGLWSVRITEPEQTPGVRGFGGFAEKDKFVALTWEYRETIIDFDAAVDDVITAWDELFQPYKPLKGSGLDRYLLQLPACLSLTGLKKSLLGHSVISARVIGSVCMTWSYASSDTANSARQICSQAGKSPEIISRLLARPANWEADTFSDLLFAISGAVAIFRTERPCHGMNEQS